MTKYTTDFKINAVQRYLKGNISLNELATELKLSDEASLKGWVNFAKEQGLEALAVKHHRRRYNLDFKLKVVEYYQTHAVGVSKVAAIFNIPASQVYSWDRAFKLGELAALIPRQKGRPSLMKKKPVKSTHQSALSLSEKHSYEEEILRLKEQLFRTEMERDILKKLPSVGSLSNKAKTLAVDSVRGDRKNKCTVNDLLTFFDLKHATYYDEKKRLLKTNKYQQIQNMIQNIFLVSHKTYGYRHYTVGIPFHIVRTRATLGLYFSDD